MSSEVQGVDQASRDPRLDDSSSGSDSHASSVEDGSSPGSSETDLPDAGNNVRDDGDVQTEELAARHDGLASFAAAVERQRNI